MAYVDLSLSNSTSTIVPIPQREERATVVERSVLPSFLYLPTPLELGEANSNDEWEVGLYARNRAREAPDRVASSAKSWLCHHEVSAEARILPWKSEAIPDERKLSPMGAAERLLGYLREVWDREIGKRGAERAFAEQRVTVTVPASFDAAAQEATLRAARRAGFPVDVQLLEEPQAAFYRWLVRNGGTGEGLTSGDCILVVDIGGGTSDFSLFRADERSGEEAKISRIAVSEHLLLGGDNLDLALAYALESELTRGNEELSADQWNHLIARARELKERCLGGEGTDAESLAVSLPSSGSGLFAGTLSTEVLPGDVAGMLLEGFFPMCKAGERPERSQSGLVEWGLPYAADCAVTRHLAAFLEGKPKVDAVLFNGGTVSAGLIRQRLLEQITAWQPGWEARVLENAESYLAVAHGAAYYGALARRKRRKIEAGAARCIYIEVGSEAGSRTAKQLCILPRGAQPGDRCEIEVEGLSLALNRQVRFQAWQRQDEETDSAGRLVELDTALLRQLPALEARIEAPGAFEEDGGISSVPVKLVSEFNEVGTLTVSCESLDERLPGAWPLRFGLRSELGAGRKTVSTGATMEEQERQTSERNIDPDRIAKAARVLSNRVSASKSATAKASRILKELETILGRPKHEWDLGLSRQLADELLHDDRSLRRADPNRESWYQIAGYVLRPGFGAPADPDRMGRVWGLVGQDVSPAPRVETQQLVFLRRLAGGFSAEQQNELFDRIFPRWQASRKREAEGARLLGSLEQASMDRKDALLDELLSRLGQRRKEGGSAGALLGALGSLLSRAPFRAGADCVMPPEAVERAFEAMARLEWKDPACAEVIPLFLKAARVVDDRTLNVSKRLSRRVVGRLEKAGVPPARLAPLRDYIPISREDWANAYGESLPPGLFVA